MDVALGDACQRERRASWPFLRFDEVEQELSLARRESQQLDATGSVEAGTKISPQWGKIPSKSLMEGRHSANIARACRAEAREGEGGHLACSTVNQQRFPAWKDQPI
jgi:hypothetical protein